MPNITTNHAVTYTNTQKQQYHPSHSKCCIVARTRSLSLNIRIAVMVERKGQVFVHERAIIVQLRWVLWSQRARSWSTRYQQISRQQFGAESSIILKFIALRAEARGAGPFLWRPAFNSSFVDSTYKCKTRQNATLTGQERQRNVQRYVSFVLLYFDFWTILVHGRFDDSSHFVHSIDTHYVWAAFGNIKAESMSKCCFLFPQFGGVIIQAMLELRRLQCRQTLNKFHHNLRSGSIFVSLLKLHSGGHDETKREPDTNLLRNVCRPLF